MTKLSSLERINRRTVAEICRVLECSGKDAMLVKQEARQAILALERQQLVDELSKAGLRIPRKENA